MKALVFTDKEQLEYQSMPSPTPKEEELLVKVSAAGICGSDMHAYHGFDDRRIPPLILGHEISGTIENSNENVIINPLITMTDFELFFVHFMIIFSPKKPLLLNNLLILL